MPYFIQREDASPTRVTTMNLRSIPTAELIERLATARAEYAAVTASGAYGPRLFVFIDNIKRELAARGA